MAGIEELVDVAEIDGEEIIEEKGTETDETDDDKKVEEETKDAENEPKKEEDTDSEKDKKVKTEKDTIEAQKRREREAREKEKKLAYNEGIKKAVDGINPYTKEQMESDEDVQIYENMREIEKKGLDPLNSIDYIKFIKEKEKVEKEEENWVKSDIADFYKEYPEKTPNDLNELLKNEDFNSYCDDFSDTKTPLKSLYASWLKQQERVEALAKEKAKNLVARKLTTPPTLSKQADPIAKSVSEMSSEEFKKYYKEKTGSEW